jgi:hypothetical protein
MLRAILGGFFQLVVAIIRTQKLQLFLKEKAHFVVES